MMRVLTTTVIAATLLLGSGCQRPTNPSFPLSVKDAKGELRAMEEPPLPALERPLVIVGGFGDPGFASGKLEKLIEARVDDERILSVSFTKEKSFDECRADLIAAVDERFGPGEDGQTIEVDVVANSMGGLIAVHAGDPASGDRSLHIARMYALSAPFRGSGMAAKFGVNQMVRDMQPDSPFIARMLDAAAAADYAIVPYVRLGDTWVGTANTAPRGESPFWVPNRAFEPAHLTAYTDPRIHADLLRRLRGETPYTTEPREPLPAKYRD